MATMPGKTARYYPNSGWQGSPFYGGFDPNVVPDQMVGRSRQLPSSLIDSTFASLPSLAAPQPAAGPSWNGGGMSPSPETAMAMMPSPQPVPAVAAATSLANPVTNVTSPMQSKPHGGLLDLIFGPSKNGLSGLAGLLGGSNAGGILSMLTQPKGANQSAPQKITGASGGGAFVASRGTPASMASDGHSNALLPSSMNNDRWLKGY